MQEKLSAPPKVCIIEAEGTHGERIYAVWTCGITGPFTSDALRAVKSYLESALDYGSQDAARGLDTVLSIPVWRDGAFTTLSV